MTHTQRLDRVRDFFPPMTAMQAAHYSRLLTALGLPEESLTDDEVILLAWCADWGGTSERLAELITRARERHPSTERNDA